METFKNYYVMQNSQGEILPQTIHFQRKLCIDDFMEGSQMTWEEVKKHGWKCLKVNVTFEIL